MRPEDWQKIVESEGRDELDSQAAEASEVNVILSEIKKGLNEVLDILNSW
jgi:hypothetical protein